MRNKIFSFDTIDHLESKLFLDEGKNIQRYDEHKYSFFHKMNERMKAMFWTPDEISLSDDSLNFSTLSEEEKFIFTENLSYQILLDSLASRTPVQLFGTICTNNELESCFITQTFFESIHSSSYTHILRSLGQFELFDKVMNNTAIMQRAKTIVDVLNELDLEIVKYRIEGYSTNNKLKWLIIKGLVAMNILEGIRFYVSFACNFSFAESGKMNGSSNIVKLIARDEKMHLNFISRTLKILFDISSEGFSDIITMSRYEELQEMYYNAVDEEVSWAKHLFGDKTINGLNVENLTQYIKHIAGIRMQAIGLSSKYSEVPNPIKWVEKYNKSSQIEVLPQETEITSYVLGLSNITSNSDYEI